MRLSVETDLEAVAEVWRDFEKTADGTAFQTYLWQSLWQRHIGTLRGVTPAIVIGRRPDGSVLFLFPLAIEPAGPINRLTWLASDLCDYNGPLLAPAFPQIVPPERFAAIWSEIEATFQADPRLRHGAIAMEKLPERVGAQPNPFVSTGGVSLNPSGAHLAHLTGDFDGFYAARRSASRRKTDRWKRRRLGHFGEVAFSTATGTERLDETLDTMFALKARWFAEIGVADVFARPGHAAFFHAVAAAPDTLVRVSRLDVGDVLAAASLGLVHRGRYYHVIASYTDGELSRFGPGVVHLLDLIAYAIAEGCSVFDFTIGDEPYKREWSDEELTLHDLRRAVTPLGALVLFPAQAGASVKRRIKQTPVLWKFAKTVRGHLGGRREKTGAAAAPSEAGNGGDEAS